MSTKKGSWEDYLEQMRKVSSPGPLTKSLNMNEFDADSLEDQLIQFFVYTKEPLLLNLRFFIAAHNTPFDIQNFTSDQWEKFYSLLDFSDLNIRSYSQDLQHEYCESLIQLYCVFSIADAHYSDEELAIVKEILSSCKTPLLLEDIKFLLFLSGFKPNRIFACDNKWSERQQEIDHVNIEIGGGFVAANPFPVYELVGAIDWRAIAEFLKDYKDYILFALRWIRDGINRKRKKREEKQKQKAEKQGKEQKEIDKANKEKAKELERLGFKGGIPTTPAPSVKDKPQVQSHPSLPLVPYLIRSYENTIIYGETKIGKTFLGVQLATDLARGGSSTLFPNVEFYAAPQQVIYYNYEQDTDAIIGNSEGK